MNNFKLNVTKSSPTKDDYSFKIISSEGNLDLNGTYFTNDLYLFAGKNLTLRQFDLDLSTSGSNALSNLINIQANGKVNVESKSTQFITGGKGNILIRGVKGVTMAG